MINKRIQTDDEPIINELDIKRLDNKFGTKSRYFPQTNTIIISMPLEEWRIRITSKKTKGFYLYHMNKRGQRDRYHLQGTKSSLYDAYDSIYNHKRYLSVVKATNTYKGLMLE